MGLVVAQEGVMRRITKFPRIHSQLESISKESRREKEKKRKEGTE